MFDMLSSYKETIVAYAEGMRLLSTNIQNFQSDGYKGKQYFFQMLNQSMTLYTNGVNFTQGALSQGTALNAAIRGSTSLFVLKDGVSNEYLYKRSSDFSFTANGDLLDSFGRQVLGFKMNANGVVDKTQLVPIKIDPTQTTLSDVGFEENGILTTNYIQRKAAISAGQTIIPEGKKLYQLAIGKFSNPDGLLSTLGNSFKATNQSGPVLGYGISSEKGYDKVLGGFREGSNVDAAATSIEGVQMQRGYNAVQAAFNMINKLIQDFIRNVAQ